MAGNAAGFSGLQLPSSSSILLFHLPFPNATRLPFPLYLSLSLSPRVYVFTALVSTERGKRDDSRERESIGG